MQKVFETRRSVHAGDIWRDEKSRRWRVLEILSETMELAHRLRFVTRFVAEAV